LIDMQKHGHTGQLMGIDYSQSAISYMQQQITEMKDDIIDRTKIAFLHMDARNMSFANESFDIVIDKATIDGSFAFPFFFSPKYLH